MNSTENVIVVPVEFEILDKYGMHAESPLVDFGRLTTENKFLLKRKLYLHNSSQNQRFEIVGFDLSSDKGLNFEFDGDNEAMLSLDTEVFEHDTMLNERLRLRSGIKQNTSDFQEYEVQIKAEIYKGALLMDTNTTLFVTFNEGYSPDELRTFVLTNKFETPLAMHFSLLDLDEKILKVQFHPKLAARKLLILQPGESFDLLQIKALQHNANHRATLHIVSNITNFEVPLVVCSGRLHVSTTAKSLLQPLTLHNYSVDLDMGAIPLAELSQSGYVVLRNDNPLPIKLSTWDFHLPQGVYFHSYFLGCLRSNLLQDLATNGTSVALESANFKFCSQLKPNDVAAYQISIQSYINSTKTMEGTLKIWSTYEIITGTVKFSTAIGKLEVDQERLYFKNCFPVSIYELFKLSSFNFLGNFKCVLWHRPSQQQNNLQNMTQKM